MDNEVAAGNTTSTLGHLALGLTLLAFGIGGTGVVDNVAASDAAALATWVGGVTLFLVGLLALRAGNGGTGTAYAALGAFWFTWGTGVGDAGSAEASGLFLLLWALLALTLTVAAGGSGLFGQGVYGLLFVALLLLGIGALADNGGLAKAGGWVAAVAGLAAWYGATAAVANWPTSLGRARRSAPAAS
ncbi:GPR1/FUN34/YaaH family transporter [Streptomyces sp. Je 1-79]|uniref:GPR1/FUN34/YaaH family transporter n=1 Tax=Streptomyces sp. Je 1-79 TaxID=2943847 RepID=UPI0021A85279|nr:GPR1/FUN34/YaaH family transporter [Streptomyces sp. Je 1-79]MCT4356132.1 GPR1/FUN34/YaaH family transporter [Streptomyces sp. Je 1-79]